MIIIFDLYGRRGYPNQVVQVAVGELKIFLVDETTRHHVGKYPWLTIVMDECSRYVTGYNLTYASPSSKTTLRALEIAIQPKTWVNEKSPPVKGDWLARGVPESMIASKRAKAELTCEKYGIQMIQSAPRSAARFFSTISTDLLYRIPGAVCRYTGKNPEKKAMKEAGISLEDLEKIFLIWLIDVYHMSWHESIFGPPQGVYAEGIKVNQP